MSLQKNIFEKNPKKTAVIFCIAIIVIFFSTAEVILKTPHVQVIRKGHERFIELREHNPLSYTKAIPSNEDMKTADGLLQKEYLLRTDNNGYIIPSKIHQHPDLTIVFLGGSTTECSFVDENLRFPYLVGRLLEKDKGLKINSYNAGRSGNNTMHSIDILLNKAIQTKPDIVVMMENINDLMILLIEKSYWSSNPSKSLIVEKRNSLFSFISKTFNNILPNLKYYLQTHLNIYPDEFKSKRGIKISFNKKELLHEFSMNLQTFIDICKIRHITPVLMTQENRFTAKPDPVIQAKTTSLLRDFGISYQEIRNLIEAFNETIRTVGRKNGVVVIDLAKEIPQTKDYIYDVVHMNNNGSQLAAQKIKIAIESIMPNLGKSI